MFFFHFLCSQNSEQHLLKLEIETNQLKADSKQGNVFEKVEGSKDQRRQK